MKIKILISILIFLCVVGIYLNRSYAFFYTYMNNHYQADKNPTTEHVFDSQNPTAKTIKYIAIGDSLTAGSGAALSTDSFPYVLAEKMSADNKIELVNLGIPGATTSDVARLELEKTIQAQPDLVTILVGTNDIHNFISENIFATELGSMIDKLKTETKAKIIVLNIPHLGTTKTILPPYGTYFQTKTKEFNKIISTICANKQVQLVDLYAANLSFSEQSGFYSPDLFHPDKIGYALWANLIYASIHK